MGFPLECLDEHQLFHHLEMWRVFLLNVYCRQHTRGIIFCGLAVLTTVKLIFLIVNRVLVGHTLCWQKPLAKKHGPDLRETFRNLVSLLLFSALQKARPLPCHRAWPTGLLPEGHLALSTPSE